MQKTRLRDFFAKRLDKRLFKRLCIALIVTQPLSMTATAAPTGTTTAANPDSQNASHHNDKHNHDQNRKPAMTQQPLFRAGLIADCQYADQDDNGARRYRDCPNKLQAALNEFNQQQPALSFIAHLGDLIDRDWSSLDVLDPILASAQAPVHHLLGNHDFDIDDQYKTALPARLGMPGRYYQLQQPGWRFVFLDGTDLSTYGWPKDSDQHQQSTAIYQARYSDQKSWNGGIGETQLQWLEQQLADAQQSGDRVVIFCHFPVFPATRHLLWNSDDVIERISQYDSTFAWINGHNHAGNYARHRGIHFVTLHAMLDTPTTAWSILEAYPDRLEIQGHGRQPDLTLD